MSSRALSVSCSKSVTRAIVASPRSASRKDFPATQSRACLISSCSLAFFATILANRPAALHDTAFESHCSYARTL